MAPGIVRWELAGVPVLFVAGSVLHFTFDWLGRPAALAPFMAVNESVWEHLKLAFWPALLYGAVEWLTFGRGTPGFVPAKCVGILLMPLAIVGLFYGYKALVGHHLLWMDILIFLIAVAAGQLVGYGLMGRGWSGRGWTRLPALAVAALAVAFAAFTFAPPRIGLFRDSTNGHYGLQG